MFQGSFIGGFLNLKNFYRLKVNNPNAKIIAFVFYSAGTCIVQNQIRNIFP